MNLVVTEQLQQQLRILKTRAEAQEFQRQEQQGLGKPIISTQLKDTRVVAVGSKIYHSKRWKTFHDFLGDYPRIVLGEEWWIAEIKKAEREQHQVLAWFIRSSEQARAFAQDHGLAKGFPKTGASSAYMNFAYNLYALHHAVEVQKILIDRIKCPKSFPGAMYELKVAAALLRAGFSLELQDETDRRSTHVEFTAKHLASGANYSVEAKRREGSRLNVNRQMYRALNKQSDYLRIVFIDTNDERLEMGKKVPFPIPLIETRRLLSLYERDPIGKTLPEAYVIATHYPEEHHLDALNLPSAFLLWGFRIEDLNAGPKSLIDVVKARRKHSPIFALIDSMNRHRNIPMTFNGEADAFAMEPPGARLRVGERMRVPGPDGVDIEATLEQGIVMPDWKSACCIVRDANSQRRIVKIPLTDEELQAYLQHPKTFFGVVDRNEGRKPLKTSLDAFDFLWESYKSTPRERLLEFMPTSPDIDELIKLSQEDLATEYCVRMATSMMKDYTSDDQ